MTYKGYTIAVEERIFNLLNVEDDGEIGNVIIFDDWSDREFDFCVFKDEDCEEPLEIGFETINSAKAYIDKLKEQ